MALLGFVYAFTSGVLDVSFWALHLPLILATLAGAATLLTGCFVVGAKNRIVFWYGVLTVYFTAGLPFAYWRGGSFLIWRVNWARTMVTCLMIAALTVTYKQSKALLNTIALASVSAAVLGLFLVSSQNVEGRLVVKGGRFGNPNDFALVLMVGLPLIWRMYQDSRRPALLRRGVLLAAMLISLVSFLRTGSRAGLYTAVVMVLLVMLRAPLMAKLQMGAIACVLAVVVLTVLPANLRNRYLTFSTADRSSASSDVERNAVVFAAGSTLGRQALLKESLAITLRHPVFGIGLGSFQAYVAGTSTDPAMRESAWLGTHNTYTQLSSEAGIPAALIFVGILAMSWRSLTRLIKATRDDLRPLARDIHTTAQAMQICLGAMASFLVFFHEAYDLLPHALVAACLVVSRAGEAELAACGLRSTTAALETRIEPEEPAPARREWPRLGDGRRLPGQRRPVAASSWAALRLH